MKQQRHPLLAPLPGTARAVESFHFGPQGAGKIYIQASLHADEIPGMLVAWYLKQRLNELEQAGRLQKEIVLVPVANPIGLEQVLMDTPLGRYELESGENFNRWFVDLSEQVGDEIEASLGDDAQSNARLIREALSRALQAQQPTTQLQSLRLTLQRLACEAEMVLDLHCDFEAVEHLYTTPEAWPQVEPLARYLGSQANLLATDSGGQSFDECFSLVWHKLKLRFGERFAIPQGSFSVTIELRGQVDVNHALASRDAQAVISYLEHYGAIDSTPMEQPELLYPATPLAGVEPISTPVGGILVFCCVPGEYLEAGQLVAEIIDPLTDQVTPVHNEKPGLLYARSLRRMATAGMVVARIAGAQAYRSGYLLSP
ncbi:succinylglutamate desuccinylase/aspartoacylase family protein [Pseudomonas sp. RIT-PI-S]|uniref:succinylglutamate desuccinylase/aspartoacylase family protein n=1 Tax=Pseudomonas sp. RIT-PI-S TaxID=3035295 RepID=UPI0021DAB48B|nr:succinylglutamate desuccinylase/aspartoacylase family protein [Pseudomonas sp. RIT-PI-S]